MTMQDHDNTLAAIVRYFETLTPDSAAACATVYAADARFQDPFHTVHGTVAIASLYTRMFVTLVEPRFVVTSRMRQGTQCFLCWEMHFRFRGRPAQAQVVQGASHLQLAPDGRIAAHRDYWDAASQLYEKLPLLGALMRWVRRRAARA